MRRQQRQAYLAQLLDKRSPQSGHNIATDPRSSHFRSGLRQAERDLPVARMRALVRIGLGLIACDGSPADEGCGPSSALRPTPLVSLMISEPADRLVFALPPIPPIIRNFCWPGFPGIRRVALDGSWMEMRASAAVLGLDATPCPPRESDRAPRERVQAPAPDRSGHSRCLGRRPSVAGDDCRHQSPRLRLPWLDREFHLTSVKVVVPSRSTILNMTGVRSSSIQTSYCSRPSAELI